MTKEQVAKLESGDQIMVTTSDGMGSKVTPGTVFTVVCLDSDGDIMIPGNICIVDHRRVDLYRKAKNAKPVLEAD
jgi:hypothetical protein